MRAISVRMEIFHTFFPIYYTFYTIVYKQFKQYFFESIFYKIY